MAAGKNLLWFLIELANAEPYQMETGELEILGEDEQGRECTSNVSINGLAQEAANRIRAANEAIHSAIVNPDATAAIAKLREFSANQLRLDMPDTPLTEPTLDQQ
jgi:hypothetical protein